MNIINYLNHSHNSYSYTHAWQPSMWHSRFNETDSFKPSYCYSSSSFPSIITCQSDNLNKYSPFSRTTWRLALLRGGRHSMTFIQHWKEVRGRWSQLQRWFTVSGFLPRKHSLIINDYAVALTLLGSLIWTWRAGKGPFYSYCFYLPLRARPPFEIGEDLFAVSRPLQVSALFTEASV